MGWLGGLTEWVWAGFEPLARLLSSPSHAREPGGSGFALVEWRGSAFG